MSSEETESDELLYTVRSFVNQLPAQGVKKRESREIPAAA